MPAVALPTTDSPAALPPSLLDQTPEQLAAWLAERGHPPMRGRQVRRWILQAGATSFADMTDLPKGLRDELTAAFAPLGTRVEQHLASADGTHKLLLRLRDDRLIECVLIQDDGRATACVSTQVGCGMGCVFCASGLEGVARNLTAGEIVEQLVRLRNLVGSGNGEVGSRNEADSSPPITKRGPGGVNAGPTPPPGPLPQGERGSRTGKHDQSSKSSNPLPLGQGGGVSRREGSSSNPVQRLTHVVVMGMGEPLANLDSLLDALAVAGSKDGLGIGARHITISTVGLPAKMRRLAEVDKQYHLAVSLHAPNDELRTRIVPTNTGTGIPAILAAADEFFRATGRQVTYEYVVLGKLNDQPEHARQLAGLLRGRKAHVNLIPWNDVTGLPYRRPTDADLNGFIDTVRRAGISVKVRKRKGSDIDAACGQLRRSAESGSGFRAPGSAQQETTTGDMVAASVPSP